MKRLHLTVVGAFATTLLLSGCGLTVPTDPDGTLDQIEGDVLRAGVSLDERLIEKSENTAPGEMAELVERFARQHDAEVRWKFGSEETLVASLEHRDLDLVIGGITTDTPWVERVGSTRGYPQLSVDGEKEMVVLVPMGQNRLLYELEVFLDDELSQ